MYRSATVLCTFLICLTFQAVFAEAQSLSEPFYNIGSPSVTDYYVDPAAGSDSNSGASRSAPKQSVISVWNAIQQNHTLTTGVRINLLPGIYTGEVLPNYWEDRLGTASAPIIMRAIDGYGTVFLTRDINMAGVSYFYLLGVDIKNRLTDGYGDAFHCERCDHVLLRGNSFNGAPNGRDTGGEVAHETVKFNQSQYIYIENNNIQGAEDNGIDWVAVQYGHIFANRIHDTQGWCMYVKGGSSYVIVESNIAYSCGEGGITAGQGTGFEFMVSPWIRHEANYIKVVNNVIHDIWGAALGVNGGHKILVAHNTAYKVGTRSHLIEVAFGERTCDGDTTRCSALRAAGGWGPDTIGGDGSQAIGNQDIVVADNVIYNPPGIASGSEHFAIYGPRTPTVSGIPSPQRTDTALVIRGNVIWNGTGSMPLGIEDSDQGCQSGNPTCTQAQILAENTINTSQPDFLSPEGEDFRPAGGGILAGIPSATIPAHDPIDTGLSPIPEGERTNTMVREFSGASFSSRPPGAFVSNLSSISFPNAGDGFGTPGGGATGQAPILSISKVSAKKKSKGKAAVNITARASDDGSISSVIARISASGRRRGSTRMRLRNGRYSGKGTIKTNAKKVTVQVIATDNVGLSTSKRRSAKVN